MNEMTRIWNDAWSGADIDCSIWRSNSRPGYFPVGDVAVPSHDKPRIGFLVRPSKTNDDSLRLPISYSPIWNDDRSGASADVQVWRVNCPAGYVALSNVATSGSKPNAGDIYCVKSEYTIHRSFSNWRETWDDAGSGAYEDVSFFEAVSDGFKQQSVRGIGAIPTDRSKPKPPYILNKDFVTYWTEKPVEMKKPKL